MGRDIDTSTCQPPGDQTLEGLAQPVRGAVIDGREDSRPHQGAGDTRFGDHHKGGRGSARRREHGERRRPRSRRPHHALRIFRSIFVHITIHSRSVPHSQSSVRRRHRRDRIRPGSGSRARMRARMQPGDSAQVLLVAGDEVADALGEVDGMIRDTFEVAAHEHQVHSHVERGLALQFKEFAE